MICVIVTHRKVFTVQKVLYNVKQLSYVILKMEVKTFYRSQCSSMVLVFQYVVSGQLVGAITREVISRYRVSTNVSDILVSQSTVSDI